MQIGAPIRGSFFVCLLRKGQFIAQVLSPPRFHHSPSHKPQLITLFERCRPAHTASIESALPRGRFRYDRTSACCGYTPAGSHVDHLSEGAIQSPLNRGSFFIHCLASPYRARSGMHHQAMPPPSGQKKRPRKGGPNGDFNSPTPSLGLARQK